MSQPNEKQTPQQPQTAVAKYENISDSVLARIKEFEANGTMKLPPNYVVENQLKSAWLILQETRDKNQNPVLNVCTKESIARSLLDMVLQGLSVVKKQAYFVAYGDKLNCIRSYFGTVALGKRTGGITEDPVANVIYEGDEFVYKIDPETGATIIVKHEQKLEDINIEKIKGAYCIVKKGDKAGVTIMTIAQIKKSWEQGATKGNSPAHKNFTDEMAKRTVINRACKMAINSSDDAWMYEGMKDDSDTDTASEQRNDAVNKAPTKVPTEDITFEDVSQKPPVTPQTAPEAPAEQPQEPAQQANGTLNGPGF